MTTKKVKNSSQSGKVNKPFVTPGIKDVLVETPVPVVAATPATTTEVTALVQESLDSFDDALGGRTALRPSRKKDDISRRTHIYEITEAPVVSVAGKQVELTKIDRSPNVLSGEFEYYGDDTPIYFGNHGGNNVRYPAGTVLKKDDLEWWKAELSEVVIYVSSGSQVNITERLSQSIDYEIDVPPSSQRKKKAELILLASSLEGGNVNIGGRVVINNSNVTCPGYVELQTTTINGSTLRARHNLDVLKGGVELCNIVDNNRITLRNKNYVRNVHIAGFNDVNLNGVTCYGTFKLVIGYQPSESLNLGIHDISLTDFVAYFYELKDEFTKHNGARAPWQNGMVIRRRTDYGYFSSRENIPFVRVGDYDIATPDQLYLAKDIESQSFPKEVKNTYAPTPYPSFGGGMLGNYEPSEPPFMSGFRGGSLWTKALKDVYRDKNRNTTDKAPVGKIGDALVQSLIEQIKSRINLYIEFSNLA